MWQEFSVPPEAPCVQGHFPGAPVVPGAWLLGRVDAAVREAYPGRWPASISKAKFLAPLRPGETARLVLEPGSGERVSARIEGPGGPVLEATLSLAC